MGELGGGQKYEMKAKKKRSYRGVELIEGAALSALALPSKTRSFQEVKSQDDL